MSFCSIKERLTSTITLVQEKYFISSFHGRQSTNMATSYVYNIYTELFSGQLKYFRCSDVIISAKISIMDERTDEQVAAAVQNGNIEAFGVIVERFSPKLARYAKKFLFDKTDAEDLLQDVFLKSFENIRSFDKERRFSPWIYRIAHNEFITALKKRRRLSLSFLDPDTIFPTIAAPETADADTLRSESKEQIDRHLSKLDAKYREPLYLFFYDEFSYSEIADILKIPIATVGVRISRGKKFIREMLEKERSEHEESQQKMDLINRAT